MASEARALLDEQIAALTAIRDLAKSVYIGLAGLPATVRNAGANVDSVASFLARLSIDQRAKLDNYLERHEHLLGPTDPVCVPFPGFDGEHPSACEGACGLLFMLAVGLSLEAEAGDSDSLPTETGGSDSLPTEAGELTAALTERWRVRGVPDWLLTTPTDDLLSLADRVQQEADAAINRISNEFRATAMQDSLGGDGTKDDQTPPHVPRPEAESITKSVQLFSRSEEPIVNARRKSKLTNARYDVVLALLRASEKGLTKDELDKKSKHGDSRGVLKRLANSDPDWESVISFPGTVGMGYHIR